MSSASRSHTPKTTVNVVAMAVQLSLLHAAPAPPDQMHKQEVAGGLVDVHDAVCADARGAHEPAQLDEEPVRVGVLLLRAAELFHALDGFLATQALSDPISAGTGVESVEQSVHALRHRTSETRMMCTLICVISAGESKSLLAERRCW